MPHENTAELNSMKNNNLRTEFVLPLRATPRLSRHERFVVAKITSETLPELRMTGTFRTGERPGRDI